MDFIGYDHTDWYEANYGEDKRASLWRIAELETIMQDAGLDPMQQPERQRLAVWVAAERGEQQTHCPEDGRFLHPLDPTIANILARKERKRISRIA